MHNYIGSNEKQYHYNRREWYVVLLKFFDFLFVRVAHIQFKERADENYK